MLDEGILSADYMQLQTRNNYRLARSLVTVKPEYTGKPRRRHPYQLNRRDQAGERTYTKSQHELDLERAERTSAARVGAESLFSNPTPAPAPQVTIEEPQTMTETTGKKDEGIEAPKRGKDGKTAAERMAHARRGIKPGQSVIRWNEAERRAFTKAYLRIDAETPNGAISEKLRRAQQMALPFDRHRDVKNAGPMLEWMRGYFDELRAELETEKRLQAEAAAAIEKQEAAEREAREAAEREEAERKARERREREDAERAQREMLAVQEERIAQERARAVDDFLASCPVEDLIAAAARRIAGAFAAPLIEGITDAFREVRSSANPKAPRYDLSMVPAAPKGVNNRPKVYVVGLIEQEQQRNLSAAFPNCDIAYGGNDDATSGARRVSLEKAASADLVVCLFDYLSHSVRWKIEKASPNFVPLRGSMSAAKRCIAQWLAGDKQLAA